MEQITQYFNSIGLDFTHYMVGTLILILGSFVLALISRFIFGKKSNLNHAVSSAIGIIFVYGAVVGLKYAGPAFESFMAPMPFMSILDDQMVLINFNGAAFELICSELLSMIILAFLVNLADRWLPVGGNVFSWIFYRFLTVVMGLLMHLIVTGLFQTYMPTAIQEYAPMILLGVLIVMLLTGALKIVVSLLVSTVNPLIAGLYAFFFASVVGKQITRSVMSTGILVLLVYGLQAAGINSMCISPAALVVYTPILVLLALVWYLVNRVVNK